MKKLFLTGLLLLLTTAIIAQSISVFHLDKLPVQDTLLSGWKFHAGDDPRWANTNFNDKSWQSIDPGQDITEFKELKNAGVGWIRLHIRADSALTKQQIAAWVYQYSASQIYLNGKLIQQFGSIGTSPSKTAASSPAMKPFILNIKSDTDNVIAVRLGYQSGIIYVSPNYTPLPAFQLYVDGYGQAVSIYQDYQELIKKSLIVYAFFGGIFLISSFIHLLYFAFDREQKISLYYCIFSGCIFFISISAIFFINNIDNVSTQMAVSLLGGSVGFTICFLFFVIVVYAIFSFKPRTLFKALVIIGVATIICQFWSDVAAYFVTNAIFPVFCMLEAVRVCLWAIRRQRKDALVILPFIIICIICCIWASLLDQATILAQILSCLYLVGLPIGMSFYLGIKNAINNRQLKTTLAEVQTLSTQNLEQEQEKQAILASQNELLERQVEARTSELNQSLTHLKQTQTQLIQSEKMASLGELTAGIAHEIQNPLNFVNNFSEVNTELIGELEQEIDKGDLAEIKAIALDIKENEKKINMHGKRADGIVKGMLQHSKSGSGAKEPTNINTLSDEYMRLAYHGMRAKDKTFNAEMVTHFDKKLPQINVIPRDIGRVMLNLFNNAFYAVLQKQKTAGEEYKAEVSVTTFSGDSHVVIKIRDNGVGIPDAIKDKIMQPFFTTKPTGEGTGLGLSLTYDMVVKGHGGSIDVNTKEGEYTEFVIRIPIINH